MTITREQAWSITRMQPNVNNIKLTRIAESIRVAAGVA